MKKNVKIIAAAVLAVLCGVGALVAVNLPLSVGLTPLSPETARLTFTEQGYYDYNRTYTVYPLVAGEVLEVQVQEGQRVQAGDVLAVVSASDYEHQIAQLRSTAGGYSAQISNLSLQEQQEKDTLRGTLEELQGQMVALEAQIQNDDPLEESRHQQASLQQSIVRQYRKLVEELEDELDWMEDDPDVGTLELTTMRQALASAKGNYYAAQSTLEQLRSGGMPEGVYEGQKQALQAQIDTVNARLQSSYTGAMTQYYNAQIQGVNAMIAQMEEKTGQATIVTPVGGVIRALPVVDQNLLSQQAPVAVIGVEELVEVYVSTRELDGVQAGDAVELLLDKRLGTETLTGTVLLVEDKAQVRYSALGVEERKVRVLVQPAQKLLIGQEVDVRFVVYTHPDALVVPKTSLFQQDGQDCVWLVRDGVATVQPVEKGIETREGYIIDGGLSPGDLVVTDANNNGLREGKKVAA